MATQDHHVRNAVRGAALATTLIIAWSPAAPAQDRGSRADSRDNQVKKFGGNTRFSRPMRSIEQLRSMAIVNRDHFARVLAITGLSSISRDVLRTLTMGNVTDAMIAPGTRLQWMALKRDGAPEVLRNVQWAGRRPFDAWQFTVTDGGVNYTFIVPKVCGNMSLVSADTIPVAAVADVAALADQPAVPFLTHMGGVAGRSDSLSIGATG